MRRSFTDIVDLWGPADVLAAEVGVKPASVRKWRQRQSIPANYWMKVVRSPVAVAAGITIEEMAKLAATEAQS